MPTREYNPLRAAIAVVSVVIYVASSLAAVPLVWLLVVRLRGGEFGVALALGLTLLGLLLLVIVWYIAAGILNVSVDNAEETGRLHRTTRAASDRQAQMLADLLERLDGLAHWTAMSEATRSLLVRQREQEVFVKQIETAVGEGDWAEAERLIELFQDHFADARQADLLREKMNAAREMADDRVIRARIGEVRTMIDERNFPAAEMALGRLAKDYPTDKRLDDLRSTFLRARRRHSDASQDKFHLLLGDRRLEEASTLLDELIWLDKDTIASLRDQWRETFRQAQHEARQAFSDAVHGKHWDKALEQGEQILALFADTTLATEVRKVIDTIRERAGKEPQPEASTTQPAAPEE